LTDSHYTKSTSIDVRSTEVMFLSGYTAKCVSPYSGRAQLAPSKKNKGRGAKNQLVYISIIRCYAHVSLIVLLFLYKYYKYYK